jgi:hypothetical protein
LKSFYYLHSKEEKKGAKFKGVKKFYYKKIETEKPSKYIEEMKLTMSVLNMSKITGSLGLQSPGLRGRGRRGNPSQFSSFSNNSPSSISPTHPRQIAKSKFYSPDAPTANQALKQGTPFSLKINKVSQNVGEMKTPTGIKRGNRKRLNSSELRQGVDKEDL